MLPLKQAVSVAILNEADQTLFVRRGKDEEEFPGCWSLPTSVFGPEHSILDAAVATARRTVGLEIGDLRWVNADIDVRNYHRLKQILRPDITPESAGEYRLLIHVVEARMHSRLTEEPDRYPQLEWRKVTEHYSHQQAYTLYHSGQLGDGIRVYLEWLWELSLQE